MRTQLDFRLGLFLKEVFIRSVWVRKSDVIITNQSSTDIQHLNTLWKGGRHAGSNYCGFTAFSDG